MSGKPILKNKRPQVRIMTEGAPWRSLLPFALPLMLGSAFQQIYTLVDTAVVGRVTGISGLAALGACDLLVWIISNVIQAYTEGFSVRMAQCFGGGDRERLHRTMATAAVLTVLAAGLLCPLMELAAPHILSLMKVRTDLYPLALAYLRVIYLGIPFICAYQYFFAVLRALGNSRGPLRTMVLSSAINIVLDLLFVAVFQWGIGGAAAATVIAQALAAGYSYFLARGLLPQNRFFSLADRTLAKWMLPLSIPMSLQIVISSFGGLVVQSVVNSYTVTFIAGYTATYKLYGIMEVAAIAYGYAVTTFTGQNLGAKNTERVRWGLRSAMAIALISSVAVAAVMLLFGRPIVCLFLSGTEDEISAAAVVGYQFLQTMCLGLPLLYLLHVNRACIQGLGRAALATVNSLFELAVRIVVALALPRHLGCSGVFLAEPAAWMTGTVLLSIFVRQTLARIRRQETA